MDEEPTVRIGFVKPEQWALLANLLEFNNYTFDGCDRA
jgi:hypothetical protein